MLTKDEFETNIIKYAKEQKLITITPKITFMQASMVGLYETQSINITYKLPVANDGNKLPLANRKQAYQFIYTLSKHTIDYQHLLHGKFLKVKHFKATEPQWGNLFKSCVDLRDYDWVSHNDHAKHILTIAPTDFYEMEYFLQLTLDYLNKKKVDFNAKINSF